MPLINGSKYSCEPCIRGHRATSCAHTDRILIEVRKPGRPLESCGHNLNTCQCGRLAESFIVGDVLSISNPQQQTGSEPDLNFIVTTPPPTSSRPGGRTRVSKKTSRKKPETPLTSSPRNRGSGETSTLTDESIEADSYNTNTSTSSPDIQDQDFVFQQSQNTFPAQPFQQDAHPYLPSIGTHYPPNEYLQYQGIPNYGASPPGMRYLHAPPPSQQQYQGLSRGFLSRIEDVRRAPGGQQQVGDGESEVRSQYIVATADNGWSAPH